jgi:hypothetical protein
MREGMSEAPESEGGFASAGGIEATHLRKSVRLKSILKSNGLTRRPGNQASLRSSCVTASPPEVLWTGVLWTRVLRVRFGASHASVTALSTMCRSTLLHSGHVNVRKSWPVLLGSMAESFIDEPQAVHCGPWFCLSSMALPLYRREHERTLCHRWLLPMAGGDRTTIRRHEVIFWSILLIDQNFMNKAPNRRRRATPAASWRCVSGCIGVRSRPSVFSRGTRAG